MSMDPPAWTPSTEASNVYSQAGPSGTSAPYSSADSIQAVQAEQPQAGPSSITLNLSAQAHQAEGSTGATSDTSGGYGSHVIHDRGRGRGRGIRGRARPRGPVVRGSRSNPGRASRDRAQYADEDYTTPGGRGNKKLNLKLSLNSDGTRLGANGQMNSFLGGYDRELDEDPKEPLVFEEHFILRVPREVAEGSGGKEGLREMVKGKGKGVEGVEFKFLDSRRAAFKFNGTTYSAKLVDLPCIIESQKTVDNRHLFKVADISQMLVVDKPVRNGDEGSITRDVLNVDDYIWPHGITPPLRHVRKRRFRKRLSRRAIEVVEEQVEELLKMDQESDHTQFDVIDAAPFGDMPDQYYANYDPAVGHNASYAYNEHGEEGDYGDPGSVAPTEDWHEGEDGYDEGEYDEEFEEGEEFDAELAAALADDQGDHGDDGGSEEGLSAEEEDDDDDGKSDEEDEETMEKKSKIRQLTSEIKALEGAIEKKKATFTRGNAIMEKRFNETIKGLHDDIKMKIDARQILIDELEEASASKREHLHMDTPDRADEGEAYDEAMGTGTGTPAFTPAGATPQTRRNSVANTDPEMQNAEEDDDDLFGDAEDDVASADGHGDQQDAQGEAARKGGELEQDEMEMLLAQELGGLEDSEQPSGLSGPDNTAARIAAMGVQDEAGNGLMDQADATAALEDFAARGLFDMDQTHMGGWVMEGGVGHRRLAKGAEGEDDDSSGSDNSDD